MKNIKKIILFSILFTFVAFPAGATKYYIAANGSDSSNGTSTSTPWLHAPGMYGCSGNCAAKIPQPGDSFILKGGDTWYTNTAAGAGEPLDFWDFWWSGNAGARIYVGVDKTWYSGGSWTRPKLDGRNPLSTSAVASCAYHSGTRNFFLAPGGSYLTIDNIEFLGFCWDHIPSNYYPGYMTTGYSHNIYQNLYFHGWTHTAFGGHGGTNGDGATAMYGDTHADCCPGNQYLYNVVDGFDSDVHSFQGQWGDGYETAYCTFRNLANGVIGGYFHLFHDNLFENIYYSDGPGAHSNGFEFNAEATGNNYVYNNVIRNFQDSSAIVKVWLCPNASTYYYNNIMYGVGASGNTFDVSGNYGPCNNVSGVVYAYNNTFVGAGTTLSSGPRTHYVNNHFIDSAIAGTPDEDSHNLSQTSAQATAQGYTLSNMYAPANGSGGTVNAGVDKSSVFTTGISPSNITWPGPSVGTRPSGSWDIGAYQYRQ
jgi:hypothetical protein